MKLKKLYSLFGANDQEPLVAIDIGTSKIKVMVIDITGDKPKLVSVGIAPTPASSIQNNAVTNPARIGQAIRALLNANEITIERATVGIPGPAVFTKKVTIGYMAQKDLEENISYEATNYIPHNINAVHLDFQVLAENAKSTMDLMLVAVKNEIVEGYSNALTEAGLVPAIADVDYFALENMFEFNYPEAASQMIALIDIGARYSSVSIISNGRSLFTGDVGVGARLYTDALVETLGMEAPAAEEAKLGNIPEGFDESLLKETLQRTTDHIASELQRQIGFFWNAAGTDRSIESIMLCGGGSRAIGLQQSLSEKTGLKCVVMDPFKRLDCSGNFDKDYLEEIKGSMGISVGLAMRRLGDKHAM